jgi:hypothetical protein
MAAAFIIGMWACVSSLLEGGSQGVGIASCIIFCMVADLLGVNLLRLPRATGVRPNRSLRRVQCRCSAKSRVPFRAVMPGSLRRADFLALLGNPLDGLALNTSQLFRP